LLGALSLGCAAACAGTLEDDGLAFADASPPTASPPRLADGADDARPPARDDDGRAPCIELVSAMDLETRPNLDASLVCTARDHVEHSSGFSGQTTPLRRAYECLIYDGHAPVMHALIDAEEPTVRAFVYQSFDLTDAWTLERIEASLSETAIVTSFGGCVGVDLPLQSFGVRAANRWPNRAEVAPLLEAWAADATPRMLALAYAVRGEERWVDVERARAIYDDADQPTTVRASAAIALAHHGQATDPSVLIDWARGVGDYEDRSIRALDVAGHHAAWKLLIDALEYPPSELLVLGAHLEPDEAVAFIDRDGGLDALLALPPRLRDPRLGALVCEYDSVRALDPIHANTYQLRVVAALESASQTDRCAAFDPMRAPCDATVLRRNGFAVSPSMAEGCGLAPPPPLHLAEPYGSCDRDRGSDPDPFAAHRDARDRERVLELERRAREALESTQDE
jgi:hypothetical protein